MNCKFLIIRYNTDTHCVYPILTDEAGRVEFIKSKEYDLPHVQTLATIPIVDPEAFIHSPIDGKPVQFYPCKN